MGWMIGAVAPTSDRRLRIWCTAAAVLPDVDALTHLAGGEAYDRWHHTFGHNLWAGAIVVMAAAAFFRNRSPRSWLFAVAFVAIAFASHLLTDMKFSGWPVYLLWPVNRKEFEFSPMLPLGHWMNLVLVAAFSILPFVLARWTMASPLEIVSPRLDHLLLNLFRKKNRNCSACGKPCNNRCDGCTRPVCLRHGKLGWRFRLSCPSCVARPQARDRSPAAGEIPDREFGFLRDREAVRIDPEFASLLEGKLTAGWKRLDALPRTDPLWQGSNHEPSLAKAADLARLLLHRTPDDEEARWMLFADSVRSCSSDFASMEPLVLRDFSCLHWLMAGARWNFLLSGVDPVVGLRGTFETMAKKVGALEPLLATLSEDPNPKTREAAAQCLDLLRGKNPWKAGNAPSSRRLVSPPSPRPSGPPLDPLDS
jgi:membrane-bound metal-dependent hydrolase YbcI (DUF457 family)